MRKIPSILFLIVVVGVSIGAAQQSDIQVVDRACHDGEAVGIEDYDIDGDTVTFSGALKGANPCFSLDNQVDKVGDGVYEFNVIPESDEGPCVNCLGRVDYDATFQAEGAFELRILHDGERVGTIDSGQTDTFCPAVYEPVCGEDGNTYSNECYADAEDVAIDHQGECDGDDGTGNRSRGMIQRFLDWLGGLF